MSGQRREFNNYTLDGVDNTDVNFNTYIFLPSVDALEEFKVQTGVYSAEFGREASQVNVVTKSGTNSLHGTVFEFLATTRSTPGRTPSRRRRPPRRKRRSSGTSTATPRADRSGRTSCSSCRTSRATTIGSSSRPSTACRRWRCGAATSRSCWPASARSTRRRGNGPAISSIRRGASWSARRGRASRFPATSSRRAGWTPPRSSCSSSFRSPTTGTGSLTNNYLSLQDRAIDKYQFTQRIDFVQSSQSTWMGRYSYGNGERDRAGAEVERHEARQRRPSGRGRQHLDARRRRSSTNSASATTTSSTPSAANWRTCATSSRSWEFPASWTPSCPRPGEFRSLHYRVQPLRRQHRRSLHEPKPRVGVHRQLSWIRGRHSFKVGGSFRNDHVQPDREPVRARQFPVPEHRHRIRVRRLHARYTQQDESPWRSR